MYLRSILLSTGTSLFCRQFQGALWGREDRLAPITFSHSRKVILRSTFQRSRGIIVKRLSPFSLERTFAPSSLNTLAALATGRSSHYVRSTHYVHYVLYSFVLYVHSMPFATLSTLVHFTAFRSLPLVALTTPVHSVALRSMPLTAFTTELPPLRSGHCLAATQRAPIAHARARSHTMTVNASRLTGSLKVRITHRG